MKFCNHTIIVQKDQHFHLYCFQSVDQTKIHLENVPVILFLIK